MLKLLKLHSFLGRNFGRLQTRNPTENKNKEKTRGKAAGDEKFIKLSRKDDDGAKARKEEAERQARISMARQHHLKLDQKLDEKVIQRALGYIDMNQINLVEEPLQTYNLLQNFIQDNLPSKETAMKIQEEMEKEKLSKMKVTDWEGKTYRQLKQSRDYFNAERAVDEKYQVSPVVPSSHMARRCGSMGYKIGMTSVYDKWGHLIPLTVIQLDRCQVLAIKEKAKHGVDSIQVGCGEKSLKTVTRAMIGNFMKANVPPKKDISEFRISPENKLPVGYMVGVRHFTIGQFVDVESKSKGKGFQGVMKRWNFKGMPASHGCSVSHRAHGSTGQRQDPGRVWKKIKMAGRMGFDTKVIRHLKVYKMDFNRSLIYVKGSIAGPIGRVVRVYDSIYHWQDNIGMLNYPTFIFEKGKIYADVAQVEPPLADPTENWLHENAVLPDDEEEVSAVSDIGSDSK